VHDHETHVVSYRFEWLGSALDRPSLIYDDRLAQPSTRPSIFFQVPEKTRQVSIGKRSLGPILRFAACVHVRRRAARMFAGAAMARSVLYQQP